MCFIPECSIFGTQSIVTTTSEYGGNVVSANPHESGEHPATATVLWDWTSSPRPLHAADLLLVSVRPFGAAACRGFCDAGAAHVQRPLSGGHGVLFSRPWGWPGVVLHLLGELHKINIKHKNLFEYSKKQSIIVCA